MPAPPIIPVANVVGGLIAAGAFHRRGREAAERNPALNVTAATVGG